MSHHNFNHQNLLFTESRFIKRFEESISSPESNEILSFSLPCLLMCHVQNDILKIIMNLLRYNLQVTPPLFFHHFMFTIVNFDVHWRIELQQIYLVHAQTEIVLFSLELTETSQKLKNEETEERTLPICFQLVSQKTQAS